MRCSYQAHVRMYCFENTIAFSFARQLLTNTKFLFNAHLTHGFCQDVILFSITRQSLINTKPLFFIHVAQVFIVARPFDGDNPFPTVCISTTSRLHMLYYIKLQSITLTINCILADNNVGLSSYP